MELIKNGNGQHQLAVRSAGRIYPVTPDGSQWEVRLHLMANPGGGEEVIGEVVFRSYNGGLSPLMGMIVEGSKLASQLVAKIAKAQADAAHQIIPVPASAMPPERKN